MATARLLVVPGLAALAAVALLLDPGAGACEGTEPLSITVPVPAATPTTATSTVPAAVRVATLVATLVGHPSVRRPSEPVRHGPVVVQVVAQTGSLGEEIIDVYGLPGASWSCFKTDGEGRAHLDDVPYDGSVTVAVRQAPAEGVTDPTSAVARAVVRGPEVVLRCRKTLLLTFEPADAETGLGLAGVAWGLQEIPPMAPRVPTLGPTYVTWGLPREETKNPAADTYGDARVSASPGTRLESKLHVRAPSRYVVWDDRNVGQRISRYARQLRVVFPLRHEANVCVRAFEADGAEVAHPKVDDFKVGRRYSSKEVVTERTSSGLRVRGIPFYRRAPVHVLVRRPAPEVEAGDEALIEEVEEIIGTWPSNGCPRSFDFAGQLGNAAVADGRLPRRAHESVLLTAVFPEDPDETVDWSTSPFFGSGGGRCCHRRVTGPTGTLEVQVLSADGRSLFGAEVILRGHGDFRSDPDGIVRFLHVPVGDRRITLLEPGLVRTSLEVEVKAGLVNRFDLREDPGGSVLVRVLDPEGLPAPFARLCLYGWIDLQDGVQRLDRFTDERGERSLHRVVAGKREVHASWAGYGGEAEVEVANGCRHELTIRLE